MVRCCSALTVFAPWNFATSSISIGARLNKIAEIAGGTVAAAGVKSVDGRRRSSVSRLLLVRVTKITGESSCQRFSHGSFESAAVTFDNKAIKTKG